MKLNLDCMRDVLKYCIDEQDFNEGIDNTWEKTKTIANKVGNHTIEFMEGVAHDVAVEFAKEFIAISMSNM